MRRWWPICVAVFAGILGAPSGAAAAPAPPFRALGGFDRIAVSFSTPRRVFVTASPDATTNATTAVVSSDSGGLPVRVAWAPGAASFALVEQGAPDWRLRVIESPDGTSHDLTAKIDALRTNKMLHAVARMGRAGSVPAAPRASCSTWPASASPRSGPTAAAQAWSTGTPIRTRTSPCSSIAHPRSSASSLRSSSVGVTTPSSTKGPRHRRRDPVDEQSGSRQPSAGAFARRAAHRLCRGGVRGLQARSARRSRCMNIDQDQRSVRLAEPGPLLRRSPPGGPTARASRSSGRAARGVGQAQLARGAAQLASPT